jgi:hypothetical protein
MGCQPARILLTGRQQRNRMVEATTIATVVHFVEVVAGPHE